MQIAALGLAFAFSSILSFGVFFGLIDAMITFSSQAFGRKEFQVCGIYHKKAILIFIMAYILTIPLYFVSDQILIATG